MGDERGRLHARRWLDDEVDPDILALDDVSLRPVAVTCGGRADSRTQPTARTTAATSPVATG